ncbi:MAG TPA: hypothetical protein VLS96_15990 [Nodosilinea sp.]|nr:hypothetical protein [Nodosilinea sp.]
MLTFATPTDEAQAAQLLQPCLIRVVDNIRKYTETLNWRSEYLEQVRWPATATADQRQQVRHLAAQLATASPEEAQALRQQLAALPAPTPAYELRLTPIPPADTQGGNPDSAAPAPVATLDVWELCFAVCFSDYRPAQPVTVDPALLYDDGEINWLALDEKAKHLVEQSIDRAIAAA